jgi:hypothetical protein
MTEPRPAMKIGYEAIARACREPAEFDVFRPARPAPGVVPKGAALAMDEGFGEMSGYVGMGAEVMGFVGYPYLAELAQRPEYRRPSEIIAKEMTRKWVKLQASGGEDKGDKLKAIETEMTRLGVQAKFREAAEQDGFFGRSQIYLDTGATDDPVELKTPLTISPAKIAKGALKRIATIEPVWTYPNVYNSNDPLRADYYKPTSWYVQGREIHASRLLTFVSREVPDLLKPAYAFGGLSLSQMAKPYIDNWLRTRQSVSDLLHSFTVFSLKTNMTGVLNGGGGEAMYSRAELFNRLRDNRGIMLLDKDTEELDNISVPLSSLDHLQAQSQEHMAAVTGIPLVKLLGITPSGLNASSDGEMRAFYDWIEAQQEALFSPALTKLLRIIQLSLFGEIDPEITFRWEPLWSLDETAMANVRKVEADTDIEYINAGVLAPHEVRVRLAEQEDSPYAAIDLNADPEPPDGGGGDDPEHEHDDPEEDDEPPQATSARRP